MLRDKLSKYDLSRKFLICFADNFFLQRMKESTERSTILDLLLTKREGSFKAQLSTRNSEEKNHTML